MQNDRSFDMPCANRTTNTDASYVRCPVLTNHFGKSTARVLQQLHYWLSYENLSYGIIHDNRQWIRNSYNQWHQQIKKANQDLAIITIRRAFSDLEKQGVVLSHCFEDHKNYIGGNQVKSYTIDYDRLESIVGDFNKTLISRPRSVQEQQSTSTTQTHNGAGDSLSLSTVSVHANAHNVCPKRASTPDQMSTPPDQMSTPLNRYISNKHSNKLSQFRAPQSIEHNQQRLGDAESIQPDKPAERNEIDFSKEMISFWNEIVEENNPQRKISLNPKRTQQLNAAFKQFFESDISKWELFCHKITTCKFLMGEITRFKAPIDWTIRFETIQKIQEGGYTFGTRESNYTLKLSGIIPGEEDKTRKVPSSGFIPSLHESPKADAIRDVLKKTIDNAQYASWFLPTEIIVEKNENGDDEIIICVQTRFMKERIKTHYRDIYERYFNDIFVGSAETYLKSKNAQSSRNESEIIIPTNISVESPQENHAHALSCVNETLNIKPLYDENKYTHIQSPFEKELQNDALAEPDDIPKIVLLATAPQNTYLEASLHTESVLVTEKHNSFKARIEECAVGSVAQTSSEGKVGKFYSVTLHDLKIFHIRKKIRHQLSESLYREWFKDVPIVIEEGRVLLHVPTHSMKHVLETQFNIIIKDFFNEICVVGESVSEREDKILCMRLLQPTQAESMAFEQIQAPKDILTDCHSTTERASSSVQLEKPLRINTQLEATRGDAGCGVITQKCTQTDEQPLSEKNFASGTHLLHSLKWVNMGSGNARFEKDNSGNSVRSKIHMRITHLKKESLFYQKACDPPVAFLFETLMQNQMLAFFSCGYTNILEKPPNALCFVRSVTLDSS